jgi:hypothetical protein
VKIAKQKNAVFFLAHAACGGAPGLSARRPVRCFMHIFKCYSVLEHFNIENVEMLGKDLLSESLPRDDRKANLFRR